MTRRPFAACLAGALLVCTGCSGAITSEPGSDAGTQDAPAVPDGDSGSDADADVADSVLVDHIEEADSSDSSLEADAVSEDAFEEADAAITDASEEESGLDAELDGDAMVDADSADVAFECGYALCSAAEVCKEYTSQHEPICLPPIEEATDASLPVCPPATYTLGQHCDWTECEALDPTCVPLPDSCDGGFSCDCIPTDFWSDFCFGTPNPPNCQEAERYVECRVP